MTPEEASRRFAAEKFDKLRTMRKLVLTVERNAKKRTPVRRGTLRRSITSRVQDGGNRGVVGTNLNYALPVHEGQRPHTIRVSRKKALRFKSSSGALIFARAVKHPGAKGQPFLDEGLADSRGEIERILAESGAELFSRIAR